MDVKDVADLLGPAGGGAIILALGTGLFKWITGASGRERVKNTNLLKRARESEAERDTADDLRREAEEHVSILKRQLLEEGITPRERENKTSK